jgi:hypothetical protein
VARSFCPGHRSSFAAEGAVTRLRQPMFAGLLTLIEPT